MITTLENDILFDDITVLEAALGSKYLKSFSGNTDNDCSNYTYTGNEEGLTTTKGTRAAL